MIGAVAPFTVLPYVHLLWQQHQVMLVRLLEHGSVYGHYATFAGRAHLCMLECSLFSTTESNGWAARHT